MDFTRSPLLVIWEVTRACALACVHCRADAIARRDPRELTTGEAFALIDQIRGFADDQSERPEARRSDPRTLGPSDSRPAYPLFVLTGGDPMWRKDLADIVGYASNAGLTVALTPSGTGAATRKRLAELRDAGLSRVAVSLDGPDPESHDAFRRVRGSFDYTMRIIEAVVDLGLPLQINTTVSRRTLPTLERVAERIAALPLALWAAFFLVQTGRGASLDQIEAAECERVLHWLHDLSRRGAFAIKTTEAPHYRRVQWEMGRVAPRHPVNDGNGFVFVDHVGDICPSGFLPVARGNVRDGALVRTYREDQTFRRLRDPDALEGRCGRCAFRAICGGSRARAFAATGNAFASDPLCAFDPGPDRQPVVV